MRKTLTLLLLFCLLTSIISVALMQTPYAQNRLRAFIEEKAEGTLTIGKLEGFFPFWFRLEDVRYTSEQTHASFDEMHLFLSPVSFLLGRVSLFRLTVNHADIQIEPALDSESQASSLAWPRTPFPIYIHSMRINNLSINRLKGITLTGMGEIEEGFFLKVQATYQDALFRITLEGDGEKQTIRVVSQIQQKPDVNLWLSGYYDWKQEQFEGETYGTLYSWQVRSGLDYQNGSLTFEKALIEKEALSLQTDLTFDLRSQEFHAQGTFYDRPFSSQGKLAWSKEYLDLSDFYLRYTENTMHGSIRYQLSSDTFLGDVSIELNDLSPIPTEHPIAGTGHGKLTIRPDQTTFSLSGQNIQWKDLTFSDMVLNGTWKNEQLTFTLDLQDFVVLDPAYEVFPTAHLKLSGEATRQHLDVKGEMWGLGSQPFTLFAHIPLKVTTRPFDILIDRTAPFSINLKGRGSIDPILAFLENASLIARGEIDLDLALTGTWDAPQIEGSLIYTNGWVESLTTGSLYRGIHVEMFGEGRELKIRSLIAHDLGRGDLSGTGSIVWNPEEGFPFSMTVYAHHFTLLAVDPLTTTVDAELTISGTIHEMAITGNATIVEGHLAIPNKMPTQVPTIDVTYINPLPTPKPEIEEDKKEIPLYWDVQIDIPRKLTIDGRGLVSEWRGDLHLYGPQENLNYSGKLKLVQGRFTVVGRTFDLTEGKILIEGLEPKDIVVDLKGDLELAAITASITIRGSLDAAQIAFSSNPPMSTNQILSWILFNQDVNELTPFQACRLANVLVQLSGKYAGPSVFNNIKEGLGIDVFDITNCDIDSADLTFQVGKYISQGTFVGVSKSISGDFDSVLIQTRLYRDFFLEGDYGGSLNGLTPNGGKIIFKWYKTY